jgi:hypothetical protein
MTTIFCTFLVLLLLPALFLLWLTESRPATRPPLAPRWAHVPRHCGAVGLLTDHRSPVGGGLITR